MLCLRLSSMMRYLWLSDSLTQKFDDEDFAAKL